MSHALGEGFEGSVGQEMGHGSTLMVALGRMEADAPLSGSQCAVCRKSINMASEDWMGLDVQVGDISIKVVVCDEHAGVIRSKAARRVTQAL